MAHISVYSKNIDAQVAKLDVYDINELKIKRLFDLKFRDFFLQFLIFSSFLLVVNVVAFSNLSSSSFTYNQLFLKTFVHKQKQNEIGLNDVRLY